MKVKSAMMVMRKMPMVVATIAPTPGVVMECCAATYKTAKTILKPVMMVTKKTVMTAPMAA